MIEDIHTFCVIAKHESFSKAARELELSTPVITRRLLRLEQMLQVRLLHRTTRRVMLTEAGRLYFDEVSDILSALEASKEAVKSLSSQVTGTLKVGIPLALSQCYVVPALKKFLTEYPNLKLTIVNNSSLSLLQNGFDLTIYCGELPVTNYYYKKIVAMRKVICASSDYLKTHGEPKTLEDLVNHNCLRISNQDNIFIPWIIKKDKEYKEVSVQGNIQVENPIELKNLAVQGVGIVYLPAYFVHEELKSGKLISILNQYQPHDYNLYAVYPSKKYMTKKTQVFLNFITELLDDVKIKNGSDAS